jgi:RNA polymerase sigma factor (sigma-70 family)
MGFFGNIKAADMADSDLVSRYRESGDKSYVGELYKRYAHLVMGVCLGYFKDRDESKDAVTRIFEKLFDELKKREIENFRVWISFVTRNFCISELRKKQVQINRESDYRHTEMATEDSRIENTPDKELQLQHLESAVETLNAQQRTCIKLFYLEGKSYQEVADTTGYTLSEVKSHLQNGKRNLKIILTEKNKSMA